MNEDYKNILDTPPLPGQTELEKPVEVYEKKEQILSYVCMAVGFVFIRLCLHHVTGLLTTLLFWVVTTLCIFYLRRSGKSFSKSHKALACVLYVFSAVYTITANHFLTFLSTIFFIAVFCLFVYIVCQPESNTFRYLPFAAESALLRHPFGNMHKCPNAAVSGVRGKSGMKNLLHVMLGLLITVPLTVIVAMLLANADKSMAMLLNKLVFTPTYDSLILIPQILFGIVIGFYLFGLLYSNIHTPKPLLEDECEKRILCLRIMPNAMAYAAATPICILYALFFVSQLQYFMGGFTGELAEGLTYAEYARKGFFELCAVCCINFGVIGIMSFFAKLCGEQKPLLLKIYTLYLSICSLVLAGTAMAKMFLYIDVYGMTQLRIYTTWFMLLLIIGFVLIIIRQFKRTIPVCKIGFVLFTVMFGLLCFSRPDAWITRYNAEMYIAGNLKEFDLEMVYRELSDDAVAVISTYQNGELSEYNVETPANRYTVDSIIEDSLSDYREDFFKTLNLSAWMIQWNGATAE